MQHLEVRRHSLRRKSGPHLSQGGVELARRVGETSGPFSLVVASPKERAVETALCMGYAVEATEAILAEMGAAEEDGIAWGAPLSSYLGPVEGEGPAGVLGMGLRTLFISLMGDADDGNVLVVTHGGIVEIGLVALFGDAGGDREEPCFGECEGFRASWDGVGFGGFEIVRVCT